MDKKQRKSIWTSLAMLIFLPLLVFWVFHDDYQEIWNNIRGVPAEGLLLLLGLGAAYQLLESAAGFTLIQSQLPDFRFWQAVEVTFLGVFANVATFSAGIIPLQSWYLYRRGLTAGSGAGTMTLEYTFHKCTILIYATAMLLLQGRWLAGENAGLARWLLLGYGVCALIITGLLLLCAWQRVQRLACLGLDRLPETGKWGPRKAAWKADLAALYAQSRRLLRDRERLVRVLGWNSLKLFCLYLTLFLSLRMVGVSVLSLWRVQLLGGLMHIIVSALPNIAGMGPAEVSFWLIFSRYMEYGQLSSALILYRTATFFVPFALSVVVFLAIQRRAAAGDRQP